jgi:hypothetical protein
MMSVSWKSLTTAAVMTLLTAALAAEARPFTGDRGAAVVPGSPAGATENRQVRRWFFDYTAAVRCNDGNCRIKTGVGAVCASDSSGAKYQAKVEVERDLSRNGDTVVSVDITIRF